MSVGSQTRSSSLKAAVLRPFCTTACASERSRLLSAKDKSFTVQTRTGTQHCSGIERNSSRNSNRQNRPAKVARTVLVQQSTIGLTTAHRRSFREHPIALGFGIGARKETGKVRAAHFARHITVDPLSSRGPHGDEAAWIEHRNGTIADAVDERHKGPNHFYVSWPQRLSDPTFCDPQEPHQLRPNLLVLGGWRFPVTVSPWHHCRSVLIDHN